MATEKRLIDANHFLQCVVGAKQEHTNNKKHLTCLDLMAEAIKLMPTVDAVEVVRCKDCKQWGGVVYGGRCRYWSSPINGTTIFTSNDDFCSYGERKEK